MDMHDFCFVINLIAIEANESNLLVAIHAINPDAGVSRTPTRILGQPRFRLADTAKEP